MQAELDIPPAIRGLQVCRRWTRDGSLNVMPLNAGLAAVMAARTWSREKALDVLLSGVVVQTPRATLWALPYCRRCGQELVEGAIVDLASEGIYA